MKRYIIFFLLFLSSIFLNFYPVFATSSPGSSPGELYSYSRMFRTIIVHPYWSCSTGEAVKNGYSNVKLYESYKFPTQRDVTSENPTGLDSCPLGTKNGTLYKLQMYDANGNVSYEPSDISHGQFIVSDVTKDTDADGIPDHQDSNPLTPLDTDGDGITDSQDTDDDGDGIPDSQDPNPLTPADTDGDGIPNSQDTDDDGDGIPDSQDPNPLISADTDGDGIPDSQDTDDDGDGIPDSQDSEPKGLDSDADGIPDSQDLDDDNDGIPDSEDPDDTNDGVSDLAVCEPLYNDQKLEEKGFTLSQVANSLSQILPSSPSNVRIPTILSNMAGDGTLAANLAIELYSGVWQYLTVIAFVKFYKLIPGKAT